VDYNEAEVGEVAAEALPEAPYLARTEKERAVKLEKRCHQCCVVYKTSHSKQKYCSDSCREEAQNEGVRLCRVCKTEKPLDSFEDIRGKWKRRACHVCTKQYRVSHHDKNREERRNIQGYLINKYEGLPCADCGGVLPFCAMDFDHRPEETKKFGVGTKGSLRATPETIKEVEEEVAKCDLICSNCHRVRTKERSDDRKL